MQEEWPGESADETLCLIALGANLPSLAGTPGQTLRAALLLLHAGPDMTISAVSRFWTSAAWPAGSGPEYTNAACAVRTLLSPEALLQRLHGIEGALGRARSGAGRWGPRTIDLDLIAAGSAVRPDPAMQSAWSDRTGAAQAEAPDRLILPHPRLQDRGFVLGPLREIAPGWRHPVTGQTIGQLWAMLAPDARAGLDARDRRAR